RAGGRYTFSRSTKIARELPARQVFHCSRSRRRRVRHTDQHTNQQGRPANPESPKKKRANRREDPARDDKTSAMPNSKKNNSSVPKKLASRPATRVDLAKVEAGVRLILEGIGEDPSRPGLEGTPRRVALMYEEICAG